MSYQVVYNNPPPIGKVRRVSHLANTTKLYIDELGCVFEFVYDISERKLVKIFLYSTFKLNGND